MDFTKLQELKTGNLKLRRIAESDRQFISDVFADNDVRKYYIVQKEAQQDYRKLINCWLHNISQGAGFAWIIIEKGSGLFSKEKQCGFFAFEFRSSIQNARISYALKPEHRGKGIATKAATVVIDTLKSIGVSNIEADIDKDNSNSEKLIISLGFKTNKSQALVDPEMLYEGEIRIRHLWKKDLSLKQNNELSSKTGRLGLNASQSELLTAINNVTESIKSSGQHPQLIAKYFYLLGRIKFNECNFEEATDAFGQCNMIIMQENLPENHETMYWFGRMKELEGKIGDSKMYYSFALERFSENPDLITRNEIQSAIDKIT